MLTLLLVVAAKPDYRVAFCRGGDIWTIRPDGMHELKIVETYRIGGKGYDRPIVSSPDGARLVYWDHAAGHWDLVACDANGKNKKNLTADLGGGCRSARYSPDGKWIAFMCDEPNGLYVMKADGSRKRRLSPLGHRDEAPVWSPDGKWIAWVDLNDRNELDVYTIAFDGGQPLHVGRGSDPGWAKPSERIIFSGGIWSIRDRKLLQSALDSEPAMQGYASPNATWMLWNRKAGHSPGAAITKTGGMEEVWRTSGNVLKDFAWSPDGSYLAYYSGVCLSVVDLSAAPPQERLLAKSSKYLAWIRN